MCIGRMFKTWGQGTMDTQTLRRRLIELLDGGPAHPRFDSAVAGFPPDLRDRTVPSVDGTPRQVIEHMRFSQAEILRNCADPGRESPADSGHQGSPQDPPDPGAWDRSIKAYLEDLEALKLLVADPDRDLFAPLPRAEDRDLLREILLVAAHNAYHLGQLVQLRRQLGIWPN